MDVISLSKADVAWQLFLWSYLTSTNWKGQRFDPKIQLDVGVSLGKILSPKFLLIAVPLECECEWLSMEILWGTYTTDF